MTEHDTAARPSGVAQDAARARLSPRARSIMIWIGMLAIVVLEVVATYLRPAMPMLLGALLALAALQAAFGLIYFMHLRSERAVLGWSLVGTLVFVLAMMNQIWPDALRVLRLRLPGQP
jgi:heme/copper-type cytochrome/quinol oxidase subunit 4